MIMNFMYYIINFEWKYGTILPEKCDTFLKITFFSMVFQMLEMSHDCVLTFCFHPFHHLYLTVRFSLSLFDCDRPFRTMANTGPKPIAHQFTDKPYFSIDNPEGSFM